MIMRLLRDEETQKQEIRLESLEECLQTVKAIIHFVETTTPSPDTPNPELREPWITSLIAQSNVTLSASLGFLTFLHCVISGIDSRDAQYAYFSKIIQDLNDILKRYLQDGLLKTLPIGVASIKPPDKKEKKKKE